MIEPKVKKKADKVFLYCETNQYDTFKKFEDNCNDILQDLILKADASLGVNKIDNVAKMLDNPAEYFVQKYWEFWGRDFHPPHTNRQILFETTSRIPITALNELQARFNSNMQSLKGYAPDVTKKGLVSNLKAEMFNKYLDESKRDFYDAIQDFIKSAKVLKDKYKASGEVHLQRYCNELITDSYSNLKVNPTNFIE